jgi:hypothetical protein
MGVIGISVFAGAVIAQPIGLIQVIEIDKASHACKSLIKTSSFGWVHGSGGYQDSVSCDRPSDLTRNRQFGGEHVT